MPKKNSPFLKRVSFLLRVPIFIARMRKPIIPRLSFLKKSRRMKKLMLLRHNYNYGFLQEYQFSPSNSPLIQYYYIKRQVKKRSYGDLYSMLFNRECLGMKRAKRDCRNYPLELKVLPAAESTDNVLARELSEASSDLSGEDINSIDERAEKFIERFYEEMRMQRQKSLVRFNELLSDVYY